MTTPDAAYGGDRTGLLVGEAHHRFFNNLQLIVSMTNKLVRERPANDRVRDDLITLQRRVMILAAVNRSLCEVLAEEALAASSLERICLDLAAAFGRHEMLLSVDLVDNPRRRETRETLVLLVSELATNAMKHAKARRPLTVRLEVRRVGDGLLLDFESDSPSLRPQVRPRVASALVAAVGGRIEFLPTADVFFVRALLPDRVGARRPGR